MNTLSKDFGGARAMGCPSGGSSPEDEAELRAKSAALATKRYGDASPANMKKLFLSYDFDKNGTLGKNETQELLSDAGVGTFVTRSTWVDCIYDKVDTNNDGQITWAEYVAAGGSADIPATGGSPALSQAESDAVKKGLLGALDKGPGTPSKNVAEGIAGAPTATVARKPSSSGGGMWLALGAAVVVGVVVVRGRSKK